MTQCKDCEFCRRDESGRISFSCDPFGTIKEPECLAKWQLIKTDQLVQAYHAQLDYYRKLAPLQEKMFKVVKRELDDMDETEKWKQDEEHDDENPFAGPPEDWNKP